MANENEEFLLCTSTDANMCNLVNMLSSIIDEHDDAESVQRRQEELEANSKKSPFYCHVCDKGHALEESYLEHIASRKHIIFAKALAEVDTAEGSKTKTKSAALSLRINQDPKIDAMGLEMKNKEQGQEEPFEINHVVTIAPANTEVNQTSTIPTTSCTIVFDAANVVPFITLRVCAECGSEFHRGDSYRRHVKQQHGPGFQCSIVDCPQGRPIFTRQTNLKKHETLCKRRIQLFSL